MSLFPLRPGLLSGTSPSSRYLGYPNSQFTLSFLKLKTMLSSDLIQSLGFMHFYQQHHIIPFLKILRDILLSVGAGSNPPASLLGSSEWPTCPHDILAHTLFLTPKHWASSCLLCFLFTYNPFVTLSNALSQGPRRSWNLRDVFPDHQPALVLFSLSWYCYSDSYSGH